MASKRLSKPGVQFHFICLHTALTSIQSSNYLPNSKPCCERSLPIPSRTPLSPSTACARPSPLVSARSLGLSVQHSSPTQDMVNLTGKRSSSWLLTFGNGITLASPQGSRWPRHTVPCASDWHCVRPAHGLLPIRRGCRPGCPWARGCSAGARRDGLRDSENKYGLCYCACAPFRCH